MEWAFLPFCKTAQDQVACVLEQHSSQLSAHFTPSFEIFLQLWFGGKSDPSSVVLFSPVLKFLCIGSFEDTFVLGLYNYTYCIWLCQEIHACLGEQFMVHMCASLRKFLYQTRIGACLAMLQGKVLYLCVRGFVWTGILCLHTLVSQESLPGSHCLSVYSFVNHICTFSFLEHRPFQADRLAVTISAITPKETQRKIERKFSLHSQCLW